MSSKNYILMPVSNSEITVTANRDVADFLTKLAKPAVRQGSVSLFARNRPAAAAEAIDVKVLDSIKTKGAKLVTIEDDKIANFRFSYPGLRLIPEKFYALSYVRESVKTKIKKASLRNQVSFKITDKKGNAIKDVDVIAFTDFEERRGNQGKTNAKGITTFQLDTTAIERIYVYAEHSYWSYFKKKVKVNGMLTIALEPIDLSFNDSLRHFYNTRNAPVITQKVRVGVIDTGVGPHDAIAVSGGKNFVLGEDAKDFEDAQGHGTHVAGIIAAGGVLPGVAHGVEIKSYRVFGKHGQASNFSIMKAITQAIDDQCDLINMSLGQETPDEGLMSSIKEAYKAGIICFAANGNDDRSPVSFPAAYSLSVAVSAMGRKGTFPTPSTQDSTVKAPYGDDKNNFIADFSNIGLETDLTAPGVGIISCFPGNLYAAMDGTSMACPAAVGMAARLLADNATLLALPRDQVRSDEILKYFSKNIQSMGFGATFEGKGMLFQ